MTLIHEKLVGTNVVPLTKTKIKFKNGCWCSNEHLISSSTVCAKKFLCLCELCCIVSSKLCLLDCLLLSLHRIYDQASPVSFFYNLVVIVASCSFVSAPLFNPAYLSLEQSWGKPPGAHKTLAVMSDTKHWVRGRRGVGSVCNVTVSVALSSYKVRGSGLQKQHQCPVFF